MIERNYFKFDQNELQWYGGTPHFSYDTTRFKSEEDAGKNGGLNVHYDYTGYEAVKSAVMSGTANGFVFTTPKGNGLAKGNWLFSVEGTCGFIDDKCSISLKLYPKLIVGNESENHEQLIESVDIKRIIDEVKTELGYDLAEAVEIATNNSVRSDFNNELVAAMRKNSQQHFMISLLDMSLSYSRSEVYPVTSDISRKVFDEILPKFFEEASLHMDAMMLFKEKLLIHCDH